MTDNEIFYHIAITKIPMIGPILAKNLISYIGSAEDVFKVKKTTLTKVPRIGNSMIANFDAKLLLSRADEEMNFIIQHNIKPLVYTHKDYPKRMLNYESSPIIIYTKGNIDTNHPRTVAIVGTRKPTDYGKSICEKIVDSLRSYNVQIISGLAYGIDSIAHKQSVKNEIPTVGILGHGLDRLYPAEHKTLVQKMSSNGGMVTEFTSGTNPDKENFPMRNRLIAMMSDAVIVIESKLKGGSIITAEYGNEYNKDVFAVPGKITDELSLGCNYLIKTNKANLITSAEDIAYIMRWEDIDKGKVIQKELFIELDEQQHKLVQIIQENVDNTIDIITYKMQCTPSELSALLLELEFKGVIKSLPGKKYVIA